MANDVCFPSKYVRKLVLAHLQDILYGYQNVISSFGEDAIDGETLKQMEDVQMAIDTFSNAPVCRLGSSGNGSSRPKKKLSDYNVFMSECMKGEGRFEGSGRKDFQACVIEWKKRKGDDS